MILQIRKCIVSLSLQTKSQLFIQKHTYYSPLCYSNPSLISSSLQASEEPITYPTAEYLTTKHQFSPKTALKASSIIPFLKNPQNLESVLSYLTENGFSKAHLEKVIGKFPKVLSAKPKTIELKIKVLLEMGFSASEIAYIVCKYPWILIQLSNCRLQKRIETLKGFVGSNEAILKAMKRSRWLLKPGLEKNVKPNIEYLKGFGISSSLIKRYFCAYPQIFLVKQETLVEKGKIVEQIGSNMNHKRFLEAVRVMCGMTRQNLELKLDLFRRLGCSEDEISAMFGQMPQVFSFRETIIEEKIHVFATEGEVDLPFLVQRPQLFAYSIDKRVKPRLQVMKLLRGKDLLTKRPQLSSLMVISHKRFVEKYVLPFSKELGDDLVASWLSKEGPGDSEKVPILIKN